MNSTSDAPYESADAEKVKTALEALNAGDLDQAESILLDVIRNTPSDYSSFKEDAEAITVKFWDQAAFLHYVTWHKNQGTANKKIIWILNAYPRAYFYLGFLCVKREKYAQAMEFLDKGEALEPTNPIFWIEKGFALMHSGRHREALAMYERVAEIGPFVSAHDIAVARRGRGAVFIEMRELDQAEAAFQDSLQFEPGNKVALNELLYIEQLRRGGRTAPFEAVTSGPPNYSNCAICGRKIQEGVIVTLTNGRQAAICKSCASEHLK